VRANLVYRDFTRVGGGKTPDAKTMGRWGLTLGPEVLKQIHERMVRIAHDKGVTAGRRMRVDTTVVETNIHHPTDSTLLGDGVRVLTPLGQKIEAVRGIVPVCARAVCRDRNIADLPIFVRGCCELHSQKQAQLKVGAFESQPSVYQN